MPARVEAVQKTGFATGTFQLVAAHAGGHCTRMCAATEGAELLVLPGVTVTSRLGWLLQTMCKQIGVAGILAAPRSTLIPSRIRLVG